MKPDDFVRSSRRAAFDGFGLNGPVSQTANSGRDFVGCSSIQWLEG